MKNLHYRMAFIMVCIFMYGQIMGQVENGCIFIDFESIPSGSPVSGASMSNQFETSFGLTFRLENGTFPKIAKVGSPVEAFVSQWGDDEPAPGVDVGEFFITDDGELVGTISSPLILDFAIPIDTFTGCILDMDFGEVFTIEALDEFGDVLLSETFTAGDPGTGDGELTCWGFNMPGCEAQITQIKFSGMREQEGGFGLGMDNFRFCYTGANIEIDVEDFSCLSFGKISINSATNETYEYSFDGVNFAVDNEFNGLTPGTYEIFIRDSDGCVSSIVQVIENIIPLFSSIDVVHTSCNEPNGEFVLNIEPNNEATVTVNGVDNGEDLIYSNLLPGTYAINIVDKNGCTLDTTLVINSSLSPPEVDDVVIKDDFCADGTGNIELIVSGGNGQISYSMNNSEEQSSSIFNNLSSGIYSFIVKDEMGCIDEVVVELDQGEQIVLNRANIIKPDCLKSNGQFEIVTSGGNGGLTFILDSMVFQNNTLFENLTSGTYNVLAIDDKGCEEEILVTVPCATCDLYFPNVITPDVEGPNTRFKIFTNIGNDATVSLYHIYDRWGNLVYEANNFSIHANDEIWWDGYFNDSKAVAGVYTYMVVVEDSCMEQTLYADDVTLLR